MADSETPRSRLVSALDEVAQWRAEQEQAGRTRLAEITAERERLLADIEELKREVAGLGELEDKVGTDLARLEGEETRRTRSAVDKGLQGDRDALAGRCEVYDEAVQAREDRVAELLADDDVTRLVEEYEQFQEVSATLASLPKGYRDSLLAHHETVRQQLEPVVDAVNAPLPPYEGPSLPVTVVCSLNPPDGVPEAMVVLLPVPFEVHSEWTERAEDLHSILTYRVVAALGAALREAGSSDAPLQFVDYRGLLAIQIWLGDQAPGTDLKDTLGTELQRLGESATDLRAAGVELYTAWLDPRVVASGDDDDVDVGSPVGDSDDDAAAASVEA